LIAYFCRMRQFAFQPRIPIRSTKVPPGPHWIHEVKHDGYRLIVQRYGDRVRLITRNGYDWTSAVPGGRKWASAFRNNLWQVLLVPSSVAWSLV
jgi:ATP-dependent DNA ligase